VRFEGDVAGYYPTRRKFPQEISHKEAQEHKIDFALFVPLCGLTAQNFGERLE
jgi:hypothetical protein